MLQIRTIDQVDLNHKRVLVRVDFNVPRDNEGQITDDKRIRESIPTIRYLLSQNACIILISHLGNPKEKKPQYSLEAVAKRLSQLIGQKVTFIEDCIGPRVQEACANLQAQELILLNNLRFHPGEKKPQDYPEFAQELRTLADVYINDAFGTAHRCHSSVVQVPQLFAPQCAAGFLMEHETRFLSRHLLEPDRPFMAIVGGAKVSSKIGILEKLMEKCDSMAIVGAMAFTFLKAQGFEIGKSLYEPDFLTYAQKLMNKAQESKKQLLLPCDIVVTKNLDQKDIVEQDVHTVAIKDGIPEEFYGVDIGEETIGQIYLMLQPASTLFWNGPAGIFEIERFSFGTRAIANIFASHPHRTIVGGGDSSAALKMCQVEDKIDHVSTGGGACLEFIEKETLPGLEILKLP